MKAGRIHDRAIVTTVRTKSKPGLLWVVAIMAIAALFLPANVFGRPHKRTTPTAAHDSAYVAALSTANRFLHAWQTGDLEGGMVLLSDRVRHSQNPDKFEEFFSAGSDRAYEIGHGTSSRGRYRFPVVLVTGQNRHVRRRFSEIIVVDTGKNDWVLDTLP